MALRDDEDEVETTTTLCMLYNILALAVLRALVVRSVTSPSLVRFRLLPSRRPVLLLFCVGDPAQTMATIDDKDQ